MQKGEMVFSIETWNHNDFGKYYTELWGPYQLSQWYTVDKTIIKNFDPKVKYIKYRHKFEDTY